MPCEQSLFYVRHDFIVPFVAAYMALPQHDCEMSSEEKFSRVKEAFPGEVEFHDLPGGRNRPLPDFSKPFYAQRISDSELASLKHSRLV